MLNQVFTNTAAAVENLAYITDAGQLHLDKAIACGMWKQIQW
jgi:hypothetical protein